MQGILPTPVRAAIALALIAVPAAAQRVDPNRLFDMTVSAGGEVMTVSIREGSDFRLTLSQRDEYRFIPVAPAGPRTVTVSVFRGLVGQPSSSRMVEQIRLAVGVPATLRTSPGISVVVDRIRSAPPAVPAAPTGRPISFSPTESWRRAVQTDQCCVCCGQACACACGVQMSCGSCCIPGCCSGGIKPTSGPNVPAAERDARLARFLGGSSCQRAFPSSGSASMLASR